MATASTEKLQSLVECPICRGIFKNPKTLQCIHFYCESCINDLKSATEEDKSCFNCPLCRQFTSKDDIRPMYFVQDLLEVVDLAKKEQYCDRCTENAASWRCHDCKENFCTGCRETHNSFSMFKNHKWEEITEDSQPVIDKHVYCAKHPSELVKFHCEDCHQLICMLCNGTTHKNHSAQTIEDALKQLIPIVKENQDKVENLIDASEKALTEAQAHSAKLAKKYENIEAEIETRCNEVIRKARDDCSKLKQKLGAIKKQQMSEVDGYVHTLEIRLKSQKNSKRFSLYQGQTGTESKSTRCRC